MKILGTILISFCPLFFGFSKANFFKKRQKTLEKLIELINFIIIEINYKKTDILTMLENLRNKKNFKNLEFLQHFKKNIELAPFPKAWELSICNWESPIEKDDKNLLNSMSEILGTCDSNGQISSLKHINSQLKESLKNAKKTYLSKGKISKSLGILIALAIFIILI